MKSKFEKLFNDYEVLIGKTEEEIVKDFKKSLIAAYVLLGEQFRKYEEGGHLTYGDMVKYGRLNKFYHELDLIINDGYKKSFRGIQKALEDTYKLNYNGTRDIVELVKGRSLIPIVKNEVIQRALSNDISGLKWTERMNLHRDIAVLRIRETVAQGLHQGETYSTMAKRLNESLSKQVVNPMRIVRTESHRVFSEARKDSLDGAKGKIKMTKTWITARDERVRGRNLKDTMDHVSMDNKTIPYDEDFKLPDGAEGFAPGQMGDYNDINCRCDWIIDFVDKAEDTGYNDNIADTETVEIKDNSFKEIYKQWDGVDSEEFASKLIEHEQLPLKVNKHILGGANGQCRLNYQDSKMKVTTYELNSKDVRDIEYKVKTSFHELFHAKSNGLVHDVGEISFEDWAYVDDIFAETTAHYLTKSVGITEEIAPAYATHLVDALPKLKKTFEFSSCKTIADFGEVAYKYRFSDNANAEWKSILDILNNTEHDIIEYSKQYISYIEENKDELVDKLLENMPQNSIYKNDMLDNIDNAIYSINKGHDLGGNDEMIFKNALIITMDRLGVK